tara:strand:- start:1911 stop:2504 length:594 start_codon:yes stop_codon:yes gene_type:complete
MKLEVLNRYHPLRADVEHYIQNLYQTIFGATIKTFPSILIALIEDNSIKAACGMRTHLDGYFSQIYCDAKLKNIIINQEQADLDAKVFEIVNLVTSSPIASIKLIKAINKFLHDRKVDYIVFAASQSLRFFLQAMGLQLHTICPADKTRIVSPQDWGTYYQTNPLVCYTEVPAFSLNLLFKNLKKNNSYVEVASIAQ